MADPKTSQNNYLLSKFPVLLPVHEALNLEPDAFTSFIQAELKAATTVSDETDNSNIQADNDTATLVSSTDVREVREALSAVNVESKDIEHNASEHPFMAALADHNKVEQRDMTNMMRTENDDLAHRSTNSALIDLFSELEEVLSGPRLIELLNSAWNEDPLMTLKIIFNARSIHLGKSSRVTAYRAFGWLAQQHPATLLLNLQWLPRPLIEKKAEKKTEEDADLVMVEVDKDENDRSRFDVKNGVAHGYWKDLLNMLVLEAEGKLSPLANPRDVLNVEVGKGKKRDLEWDEDKARVLRHATRDTRYENIVKALNEKPFYRAFHMTVARLFAEQLKEDLALLRSTDPKAKRRISLCAKWAPSHKCFHDKHTFIVSTIAEILHPQSEFSDVSDRETYLRHAREAYRKDCSALRKQLEVVERDITAGTFKNIKYDRVPSVAMNNYASLFAQKDETRFDKYIEGVAEGKKRISGATLLPSKMIRKVRESMEPWLASSHGMVPKKKKGSKCLVDAKLAEVDMKVLDGQWKTLVQRIKDSGTLESSIAVCDVSGSMEHPSFPDGTTPMDSSIALSLILSEVVKPPFGGSFITFHDAPQVMQVPDGTFAEKVKYINHAPWGGSTNFEAVFTRCILPLARKHKLKQEDMVKQIFVFSDMQFNQASSRAAGKPMRTSFERIREEFADYGYEMPKLIFWNLAGGRAGYGAAPTMGDPVAPKPVTDEDTGACMVSGYSQAMLKIFLDGGSFEDAEEEELVEVEVESEKREADNGDEAMVEVQKVKKQKMDPMSTVRKAIGHKAYDMLKVVD